MLESLISSADYHAEAAYRSREFATEFLRRKRYTMQDITAEVVEENHPHRAEVEAFVAEVFAFAYGAHITQFMPKLIALRDQEGTLMAAFGMRDATKEHLFLEQYIDEPIEKLISKRLGKNIHRNEITEIGNLAVANPRNAGILISHVIQYSLDIGIQWCVATAHHSLQNGLIKGGRDVYALHAADKNRLPAQVQKLWGSYYDNAPQIVAVRGVATLDVAN